MNEDYYDCTRNYDYIRPKKQNKNKTREISILIFFLNGHIKISGSSFFFGLYKYLPIYTGVGGKYR